MSRNASLHSEGIKISDPKKYAQLELYANHLNAELKKLSILNSNDVRSKACSELAHILYHGAILEAYLLEDQRVIDILLALVLNAREPPILRIAGLKAFSSLCVQTEPIRLLVVSRKSVLLLIRLFQDSNSMIRKWAVHCVFLLMLKHHRNYQQLLKGELLSDNLTTIAMEDWSAFRHNDAERFLSLVKEVNVGLAKPKPTLKDKLTKHRQQKLIQNEKNGKS